MTITNGTVEYERVVRPAEFESKRAKVTLFFAADDGAAYEDILSGAMAEAMLRVHVTLGLSAAPQAGAREASLQPGSAGAAPQGTGRGRPRAVAEPTTIDPFGGTGTATAGASMAMLPSAPTPAAGAGPTAPMPVSHSEAEMSGEGFLSALQAKIGAVPDNEREALTGRIRALIAEFNDGDHVKSVHMIVKERRGAFLDRLAALK